MSDSSDGKSGLIVPACLRARDACCLP
eukprot:COSAG06_NODE_49169_length_327_cov_0.833333_1_plen_26_part_01